MLSRRMRGIHADATSVIVCFILTIAVSAQGAAVQGDLDDTGTSSTSVGHTHTAPTTCAVCSGDPAFCERQYTAVTCSPPNNYCINNVVNSNTGTRYVTRRCGNYDTCNRDWYQASSDNSMCLQLDPHFIITLQFNCTYCCTGNMCNVPIKPKTNTLWSP